MSEITPFLQEEKRQAEEMIQRQRGFYAQLVEQPKQVIRGLVGSHGGSGSNPRGLLDCWLFTFSLDAWTDGEGRLHREEMTVRKVVDEEEFRSLEGSARSGSIVSLVVHVGELKGFPCRQGALVEVTGSGVEDEQLKRYAEELAVPVTVTSKILGRFTLDRGVNWFEGDVRWGLRKIRVNLSPEDIAEPQAVVRRAEELWAQRKELTRQAREFAAATLLEDKNGAWLDDDESPLTEAQFMRKMKLESITVEEDGGFEFWFGDGGMFSDHSIDVRGDAVRGFFDAGLQG